MSPHSCALSEPPSASACPPHLTAAQAQARRTFDLERCVASLPASTPHSTWGAAGARLQGHFKTTIPDDDLRDFAKDVLGAARIREPYLDALRVILGNQAEADRRGHTLEMNIRTDFATERAMRNIINQMKDAGITEGRQVDLGGNRAQVVQCYHPPPVRVVAMPSRACRMEDIPEEEVPY